VCDAGLLLGDLSLCSIDGKCVSCERARLVGEGRDICEFVDAEREDSSDSCRPTLAVSRPLELALPVGGGITQLTEVGNFGGELFGAISKAAVARVVEGEMECQSF